MSKMKCAVMPKEFLPPKHQRTMVSKLQKRVRSFVESHHLQVDVKHRVLDLASEVGELSKEVLKSTNYGKKKFSPSSNWSTELGDITFVLVCLANTTGVDLEKALSSALKKYRTRAKKTKQIGSGA